MTKHAEIDGEISGIADACMTYLIANPEELSRFMAVAGYDGASLRAALESPHLASGLLDYVVQNESLLLAVSANAGLKPERVMYVWQRHNPDH